MIKLDENFTKTIEGTYKEKGVRWLQELPQLIEQCVTTWNLSDIKTVSDLSYNYVAYARQAGRLVVLKLRCSQKELQEEILALQLFAQGAVDAERFVPALLAFDYDMGALLVECVEPGTSLVSFFPTQDERATKIAAGILHHLHQTPVPEKVALPNLKERVPIFEKDFAELQPFLKRGRVLRSELLATTNKIVLLHGDFHHNNILAGPDANWYAIDPEGILGDPGYDMAWFIRNPLKFLLQRDDTISLINDRIAYFAAFFDYDAKRLFDWVFLATFISAYWSLSDGLESAHHCALLTLLGQ